MAAKSPDVSVSEHRAPTSASARSHLRQHKPDACPLKLVRVILSSIISGRLCQSTENYFYHVMDPSVGPEAPFTQANTIPDPTATRNTFYPPTSSQPVLLQFPICVGGGVESTKQDKPKAKRPQNPKRKRRRPVPKTGWQLFRDAFDSDVSSDNDASSSEKDSSCGPYFQEAPVYHNKLLHDLWWDRLHQPAFSPGPLAADPVYRPEDYLAIWNPRVWLNLLEISTDWLGLGPGCARVTTKAILSELVYNLDNNPDVFRIVPFSGRKVYSYAPEVEEVETRPFHEKRMPVRANLSYPLDKRH